MKNFMLAILVLFPTLSYAQVNWDDEYKQVKSYDKWSYKLKYDDGAWKKPKPEIVKLLKELKPTIMAVAAKLGVSPIAIAGAIMAENSLNVSVSDDVQDILVRMGVADKGEILGKKFTFGLGQLNFPAAREADNHAALLEKRAPLSDSELTQALLIPERAIYYVGAVLRQVQDDYKDNGIDISQQPEILTTLYNLGKSEAKAKEAKASNTKPRMNYFGLFVKKNTGLLSFLNAPVARRVSVASPVKAVVKAPVVLTKAAAPEVHEVPKVLTVAFSKNMALYAAPPSCKFKSEYGGTDTRTKYERLKNYPVTTVAEKGSSFTVLAPSIDCEANNWKLLKLQNGEIGWIKEDDLLASSGKVYAPAVKCTTTPEALKCAEGVMKTMKDYVLDGPTNGLVFLKPYTIGIADFSKPDWECREGEPRKPTYYPGSGPESVSNALKRISQVEMREKEKFKIEDLKKTQKIFEKKIKQIEAFYKFPLSDPRNPYSGTLLLDKVEEFNKCVNLQDLKLKGCNRYPLEKLNTFIEGLPAKTKLDAQGVEWIGRNLFDLEKPVPSLSREEFDEAKKSGKLESYTVYREDDFTGYTSYQHRVSEADLEKWSLLDLESTFNSCVVATDELISILNSKKEPGFEDRVNSLNRTKKKGFVDSLALISQLKLQADEEDKQVWKKTQPYMIQLAKICLAFSDSLGVKVKDLKPSAYDYACEYAGLKAVQSGDYGKIINKELFQHMLLFSSGVDEYEDRIERTFANETLKEIADALDRKRYAPIPEPIPVFDEEIPTLKFSFCPNRTAELIENLMESQPCVKHVYISDEWMLARLNTLGNKVAMRPFDSKDRYAVDVGALSCK